MLKASNAEYLIAGKILASISVLIQIPKILQICDTALWLHIATLQAIAVILSPIVQMHWAKFGGITLLQNTRNNQKKIILQSVVARLASLTLLNIIALCLVHLFIENDDKWLFFGAFFYASSMSLSNEWYYLAKSNFRSFFLKETAPRFLSTSILLLFIDNRNHLIPFFFALTLVNLITCAVIIEKRQCDNSTGLIDQYSIIEKVKFTFLQFLTFLVLFSPVPLVNIYNLDEKFHFTILEKFFRLIMTALIPISQLARSQIITSDDLYSISRYWYNKNRMLSLGISVLYLPSLIVYLWITGTMLLLTENRLLIFLFGLLVVITSIERVIEEIFVLNILDIRQINTIQVMNLIYLLLSFTFSVRLGRSMLLVVCLILSELCRCLYMRNRLTKFGIIA